MPKKGIDDAAKMVRAARLYNSSTIMTAKESLAAAGFANSEVNYAAWQMRLRRTFGLSRKPSGTSTTSTIPSAVVASPASTVSAITAPSPAQKFAPPKTKEVRSRTSTGSQQNRQNVKSNSEHEKKAFKAATTLLAAERQKENGMSNAAVISQIIKDYGVTVARSSLNRYVQAGDVGTSPKKAGNPGKISEWVFQTLCTATSSFIKINQLNAREVENDRKRLKARVNRN
jgi:hypothetical protein